MVSCSHVTHTLKSTLCDHGNNPTCHRSSFLVYDGVNHMVLGKWKGRWRNTHQSLLEDMLNMYCLATVQEHNICMCGRTCPLAHTNNKNENRSLNSYWTILMFTMPLAIGVDYPTFTSISPTLHGKYPHKQEMATCDMPYYWSQGVHVRVCSDLIPPYHSCPYFAVWYGNIRCYCIPVVAVCPAFVDVCGVIIRNSTLSSVLYYNRIVIHFLL